VKNVLMPFGISLARTLSMFSALHGDKKDKKNIKKQKLFILV